jgi:hypothetical protein
MHNTIAAHGTKSGMPCKSDPASPCGGVAAAPPSDGTPGSILPLVRNYRELCFGGSNQVGEKAYWFLSSLGRW